MDGKRFVILLQANDNQESIEQRMKPMDAERTLQRFVRRARWRRKKFQYDVRIQDDFTVPNADPRREDFGPTILKNLDQIEDLAQQIKDAFGPIIPVAQGPIERCSVAMYQLDQILWLSKQKGRWVETLPQYLSKILKALLDVEEF
jgi:hypothetical protein